MAMPILQNHRRTMTNWPPPGLVFSTCPDKLERRLLRNSFPHFLTLAGNPSLNASHDIALIFLNLMKTRRKSLNIPASSEPHKIPLQLATQYWVTVYQKWNVNVFQNIFKIKDKKFLALSSTVFLGKSVFFVCCCGIFEKLDSYSSQKNLSG